jgi:hypothetical protein
MAIGVAVAALADCELLVNLDRGEVSGAGPQGCPICTAPTEGGEDADDEATLPDGGALDGSGDGTISEARSTDASGDGTEGDGGVEGATTDSGAGE